MKRIFLLAVVAACLVMSGCRGVNGRGNATMAGYERDVFSAPAPAGQGWMAKDGREGGGAPADVVVNVQEGDPAWITTTKTDTSHSADTLYSARMDVLMNQPPSDFEMAEERIRAVAVVTVSEQNKVDAVVVDPTVSIEKMDTTEPVVSAVSSDAKVGGEEVGPETEVETVDTGVAEEVPDVIKEKPELDDPEFERMRLTLESLRAFLDSI